MEDRNGGNRIDTVAVDTVEVDTVAVDTAAIDTDKLVATLAAMLLQSRCVNKCLLEVYELHHLRLGGYGDGLIENEALEGRMPVLFLSY